MKNREKSTSVSRRNVLVGLGLGAAGISAITPAEAGLLPAGRQETFDVVVIGMGLSGSSASLQAKLDGANVMTLEKTPENRAGGNSRVSAGLIAIPTTDTPEAKAHYLEDFIKKSEGRGNIEIYKVLAERSFESAEWLKSHGAPLLAAAPFPPFRLNVVTGSPGAYVGMPNVLGALRKKYLELGGKVAYDTKAKQLIMDDKGKVVGVRAVGPQGVVDYMAKAVVIAAGGYAANKGMLQQNVDPNAGGMMVRGRTWATGDGHMLAQEAGAGLINMTGLASLHIAGVNPKEPAAGNPFHAVPFCLAVNLDGKRYVDESLGYVANGKAIMQQPKQTGALIFDEAMKEIAGVKTSAGIFERLKLPLVEGNTLEELAGKLGMPPAALVATVKAFNDQVKDGKALGASPPKAMLAHKLEKPKFYAFFPLVPGITLSFGGIMIDTTGRVLEPDGRVIPGLYASGEGAGGLYVEDYVGGGSLANCLVMGRVAGASAAKFKA